MRLHEMAPRVTTQKVNKMCESRFGVKINFNTLTVDRAHRLIRGLDESLSFIRKSFDLHSAERNPKYMELLTIKENLQRWVSERRQLVEGELGRSEAILAAKNMVDELQSFVEKISKMQNEQMLPLLDSIRDQIGTEQADQFKGSVQPILSQLMDTVGQAREQLDSATRALTGEMVAPTDMGVGGGDMAGGDAAGMPGGEMPDAGMGDDAGLDADLGDTDGFNATDAASGGAEGLGRERRAQ